MLTIWAAWAWTIRSHAFWNASLHWTHNKAAVVCSSSVGSVKFKELKLFKLISRFVFFVGLQPDKRLWSSKSCTFIHRAAYCATPETFSSKLLDFNLLTPSQFHIQLQARFSAALFIFTREKCQDRPIKTANNLLVLVVSHLHVKRSLQ